MGSRDCQTPENCDTRFHPTELVDTKHCSLDLNPVDYKIWGTLKLQEREFKTNIKDVPSYENALRTNGISSISASLTKPLENM